MSSKKAKLVVRATYGVMQQNDRGICFRWLGDNNTHKDATLGHSYSLALEDLFSRNKGRIEQNKETRSSPSYWLFVGYLILCSFWYHKNDPRFHFQE